MKKNSKAKLVLIDPSDAIFVAKKSKRYSHRILFIKADITKKNYKLNVLILYSLGVIHHIPGDLQENLKQVVSLSKKNLIYLYYSLDNRDRIVQIFIFFSRYHKKMLSKNQTKESDQF